MITSALNTHRRIGRQTPAEIAVLILAEVTARRNRAGQPARAAVRAR